MWKSKLKDVFYIAALLTLGWFVYAAHNNKEKIAYIDVKRVFDEFDLKKELQKKYNEQMAGKKKMLDEMGMNLQTLGLELESSEKPDQKKMDEFITKRKQYMELVKVYDEEDKKVNGEYDEQIIKQMNQYVKEYGDENGYSLIFGSLGNGTIMQAKKDYNVTDEVIKFINKKYSGK